MGRRFKICYKHIFPASLYLGELYTINDEVFGKRVIWSCGSGKYEDFYDNNKRFKEIKNMETIVEYIGDDEYKDLLTGETYIHYLSDKLKYKGDKRAKSVFKIVFFGLSSSDYEVSFEESEEFLKSVSENNIQKIKFYIEREKYQEIYWRMKFKQNTELYNAYLKKLDDARVYDKFLISYSDLFLTNDGSYCLKNDEGIYSVEEFYSINKENIKLLPDYYTIIQYMGNDIYKDLTTKMYISGVSRYLHFDGEELNEDDYLYIMKYPYLINYDDLKYISDEDFSMLGETINNIAELKSISLLSTQSVCDEYDRLIARIKDSIRTNHENSSVLNEKPLEQSKDKEIVKKFYRLK